jgi:predicted small metal-binding protein
MLPPALQQIADGSERGVGLRHTTCGFICVRSRIQKPRRAFRPAEARKEVIMPKILSCGDLMPGCDAVMEGKDVGEVMAKAAEHAKTAHGVTTIPPEIAAKAQAAIRDR